MPRKVVPSKRPEPEDRDPNKINQHIKVSIHDVIGEPRTAWSCDICWDFTKECYTCFFNFCYGLWTCLCAPCLAGAWGCQFGVLVFYHIWFLTPFSANLAFCSHCMRRFAKAFLDCCVTPCTKMCGGIFVAFHTDIPEEEVLQKTRITKIPDRNKKKTDEEDDNSSDKNISLAVPVVVLTENSFISSNKMNAQKSIQRQIGMFQ